MGVGEEMMYMGGGGSVDGSEERINYVSLRYIG